MKYRLTKISAVENPRAETAATIEEYRDSLSLYHGYGKSPNVDYWVEGEPIGEPIIGEPFFFNRDNRNGVKIAGIMNTSRVQKVEYKGSHIELETQNSVYILEPISEATI